MKWSKMSEKEIKEFFRSVVELKPEDIASLREDTRKGVKGIVARWEREQREKERVFHLYQYERKLNEMGIGLIAGIDEVGRGPLAGPVVAAAVILPRECFIAGINDSKKISETKRYAIAEEIRQKAVAWSVGAVGSRDIDRLNIYRASCLAMKRAVKKLSIHPEHLLIDAVTLSDVDLPQTAIIKGDSLSASIAAASIIAKCHRDDLMRIYDRRFPGYGFAGHKGYPTAEHFACLRDYGETSIHRKTFNLRLSTGNQG